MPYRLIFSKSENTANESWLQMKQKIFNFLSNFDQPASFFSRRETEENNISEDMKEVEVEVKEDDLKKFIDDDAIADSEQIVTQVLPETMASTCAAYFMVHHSLNIFALFV